MKHIAITAMICATAITIAVLHAPEDDAAAAAATPTPTVYDTIMSDAPLCSTDTECTELMMLLTELFGNGSCTRDDMAY